MKRISRNIVWVVLTAAVLVWVFRGSGYNQFLAMTAVNSGIVLLGVGVIAGDAGMTSLCQMSFAAVSAYIVIRFAQAGHPLSQPVEILIAVAAAGFMGAIVSLPALRLRTVNLAVVTLGLGSTVSTILAAWTFPRMTEHFVTRPGFAKSDRGFLAFSLVLFGLVAGSLEFSRRRPFGALWKSVRYSERATAAMGYSVTRVKIGAFTVAAVISGIAGVLVVMQIGYADSSSFPPLLSLVLFAVGTFLGVWRWQGALLGGTMSVAIPEFLSRRGWSLDYANLLFGIGATQALATGRAVADDIWPQPRANLAELQPSPLAWQNAVTKRAVGTPRTEPVLVLENIVVRYGGVTALDLAHLEVKRCGLVGLLGANGAGKTSLVDAITGYVPYTGTVHLDGHELKGPPHRRAVAGLRRTFQQERVVPSLSVEQYLSLNGHRRLDDGELDVLLWFAGVPSADVLVEQLTGATRRLLEVAGAFASRPHVVFLDEPVAGLSNAEAMIFAEKLQDAPTVFNSAVVLIEHDVHFVRSVCTDAVALDFGRVIGAGVPDELLDNPAVRAAYLGQLESGLGTNLEESGLGTKLKESRS
jgi:branched-chain amino acid transport system permease protein